MFQLGADDPRSIGSYEIVGKLGEGGMGTVYKGRSRGGRSVAVKVAKPELGADPDFRARFRTEIEAAQRVGGFHTAQVIDADPDAVPPWMTTAFIPGRTLARAIGEDGPMDEERLCALGAALAEALQAIHGNDLVHRDLKPANIILSDDGPRVLDFGIARALEATRFTNTHVSVGTPGFFSPEQVQGDREIGPPADVFALGAVLVHAAGGRPFGEGDSMTLMYRAVHNDPNLTALPASLQPLVAACMDKEPERRPTPEQVLAHVAPRPGGDGGPAAAGAVAGVPAPAPGGAFGPAPSVFTDVREEGAPELAPEPESEREREPAVARASSGRTPAPAPAATPMPMPTPAPTPTPAPASAPTPTPTPAPATTGPATTGPATTGPVSGVRAPADQVTFVRGKVWRTLVCTVWSLAFAGLTAPMVTLQALHENDPGSVFYEPLPLVVPVNTVMCVLFVLAVWALFPYRVTVDAEGVTYRQGVRTVRVGWNEVAGIERRKSSLVLHRSGGGGSVTVRKPPMGGGRHAGLSDALARYAPPSVVIHDFATTAS
ncbi:hypothetical protein GCM10009801_55620 [Streptomyces albiaxialis]|uniref:Protein kinase domain-containing protein n=1 Tax=Streptomyces albiaxialis TaxID=329523 RepID=A0ABN2WEI2_9ACTN